MYRSLEDQVIRKYDMVLSKEAYKQRGFHHAVTTKSYQAVIETYAKLIFQTNDRPKPLDFIRKSPGFRGTVISQSRNLNRVGIDITS